MTGARCGRCGHDEDAHQHYRRGTECSATEDGTPCPCPAWVDPGAVEVGVRARVRTGHL